MVASAGRAGAAVAASKPKFPDFSAVSDFETSPRVEIAVLASSACRRYLRVFTTITGKKKSAPSASGGARNDKTGKIDLVQLLNFFFLDLRISCVARHRRALVTPYLSASNAISKHPQIMANHCLTDLDCTLTTPASSPS